MTLIRRETDYAVRILVRLSKAPRGALMSASRLSREERVPLDLLRKILLKLLRAGLLRSKEGKGGGYLLKRSIHKITLAEIMNLFQGRFHVSRCASRANPCPNKRRCVIRQRLLGVESFLMDYFNSIFIDLLLSGAPSCEGVRIGRVRERDRGLRVAGE